MPFGLKNAKATYQRLMDKVFSHLIGKIVEVYVDDMVVKSLDFMQHSTDLVDVFATLRKFNLQKKMSHWGGWRQVIRFYVNNEMVV